MKKKMISVLLTAAMAVTLMMGCGSSEEATTGKSSTESSTKDTSESEKPADAPDCYGALDGLTFV